MGRGVGIAPKLCNVFLDLWQAATVLGLEGKLPSKPDVDLGINNQSLKNWRNHSAKLFAAYQSIRNTYREYNIDVGIDRLYSGGSLAKGMFKVMGIKPFLVQNPGFDPGVLGKFMAANLGGRTENMLDGVVAEVAHLDFGSQYPSQRTIFLWSWRRQGRTPRSKSAGM